MLSIVPITIKDKNLLQNFISSAGNSLESFRYFDKRPITALENHISTYLLLINDLPVAYGHLDSENDVIWLGIAVIENYRGMGLGKLMLNLLLTDAKLKNINKIKLSVDNDNIPAIQLYQQIGFTITQKKDTISFLQWIP